MIINEFLTDLHNEKTNRNCSFLLSTHKNEDFVIFFVGCNDFVIASNYWGAVAYGCRSWNFDTSTANYIYQIVNDSAVSRSICESMMAKYERNKLQTKGKICFTFERKNQQ